MPPACSCGSIWRRRLAVLSIFGRLAVAFWKSENVDGVTHQRAIALESEHAAGPNLWAAAVIAGRNRHELLAADAEGRGETLRRRAQPGLPQGLAGLDVEGAEGAVPVADKADAAGRGDRTG